MWRSFVEAAQDTRTGWGLLAGDPECPDPGTYLKTEWVIVPQSVGEFVG